MVEKLLSIAEHILSKYGLWALISIILLSICWFLYMDIRHLSSKNLELQTQHLFWMQSINYTNNEILKKIDNKRVGDL